MNNINKFDLYLLSMFHLIIGLLILTFIVTIIISQSLKELKFKLEELTLIEYSLDKSTSTDTIEIYVLKKIMEHEGFREKRYNDIAGHPTIGFGHKIKKGEHYRKVSRTEALDLLKRDFEQAKQAAIRLSPHLNEPNNVFKFYAIAHFIYGKGVGAYTNSQLRQKINNCKNVDDEFRRWVYATVDGKKVKLSNLEKIAEWRIELYNK